MSKLATIARRFVREEEGATMVEYALVVAVVALIAVVGFTTLGRGLSTKMEATNTSVQANGS